MYNNIERIVFLVYSISVPIWNSERQDFHKSAAELNITARVNLYYILGDKVNIYELITMVETRLREAVKDFRPIYKL